ncbi:MAG: DMT family transporter [Pseudobdellovibrionaceae bacterium]
MGFVAAVWSLKFFTTAEVLFLRFAIASVVGFGLQKFYFKKSSGFTSTNPWLGPLLAGLMLCAFLIFQVQGLLYTTAGKSGFITCLYIVFVPLLLRHFNIKYIFSLMLSLLGLWFLTGATFNEINKGDLLTLVCAVIGSFHILWIDFSAKKSADAFHYNNWQSLFALVGLLPLLVFQKQDLFSMVLSADFWLNKTPWPSEFLLALLGLLILSIGCSLIAFYIQVRAQKVLHPTTASMLFLLESPFALLFGFYFLNESLNWTSAGGALLIFIAAVMAIF